MISYVIPSYNRPDTIGKKTLKMLMYNKIPKSQIFIVVADKAQGKLYANENEGYNIVIGVKGIIPVRNFIRRKWTGKKIVMIDDDISSIRIYKDIGKWGQLRRTDKLDMIMKKGFNILDKTGGRLIVINNSGNTRSLNEDITTGLVFVAGIWGEKCDGKIQIKNDCSSIEDTLCSLAYYHKYGNSIKFNGVSHSEGSNVGIGQGGNQDSGMDRTNKTIQACQLKYIIKPNINLISSYKLNKFPSGHTSYKVRWKRDLIKVIGKL